ncbi:MAG: DUF222 domain-containing protein [Candidatus Microbacterium phytovorans]|uniref:DUF222 domain-containing protein n=1 Tax=Candidatus Microbacterium phytovorans TaxID=3121374 RepID=A0AAJ6B2S9_9MICO|nr:HNH endonuclease signature motif containing protein [Microbacterium sp.]WEK12277.1 MAG: DUF222 domain-containing protein [Microbacterium sp.]
MTGTTPTAWQQRIETLLHALADARRDAAAAQAREAALLAEAVEIAQAMAQDAGGPASVADIPIRSLAAQIGAAARMSDRTVQKHMSDAVVLVERFPATFAGWACGDISRGHVRVVVDAGAAIDDDAARAVYEDATLEIARRETPGRLKPAARILAARLHPIPLQERHAAAATKREVWVRDLDDGMAELIAILPAAIAHGIRDRLDQYARRVVEGRSAVGGANTSGTAGSAGAARGAALDAALLPHPDATDTHPTDNHRISEVRADVFADLLLTGHATPETTNDAIPTGQAIIARVQVTVPALTAVGHDDTPAELIGKGPIDTATALRLAGTATGWDRVLTHPATGTVLATDRYRPNDHLKRTLRVRDEHCRFPGCRTPTDRSDIDHTTAREHDGPTELTNLAHLCRRHHTLKHHSAWRVRQTPDGILHWTSPTGREYPDHPARTLTFTTAATTDEPDTRPHPRPSPTADPPGF